MVANANDRNVSSDRAPTGTVTGRLVAAGRRLAAHSAFAAVAMLSLSSLNQACTVVNKLDPDRLSVGDDGKACSVAQNCTSGYCVDGVCCQSACSGPCQQCNAPGAEGTCTIERVNTDPLGVCDGSQVCSTSGQCGSPAVVWRTDLCLNSSSSSGVVDLVFEPGGDVIVLVALRGPITVAGTSLTPQGEEDILLVRLNDQGEVLWHKQWGGPGRDQATAITTVPEGNIFMAGWFNDDLSFPPEQALAKHGTNTLFVAVFDENGEPTAAQSYAVEATLNGENVPLDVMLVTSSNGQVYLAGSYQGEASFTTGTLSSPDFVASFLCSLYPHGGIQQAVSIDSLVENGPTDAGATEHVRVTDMAASSGGKTLLTANVVTGSWIHPKNYGCLHQVDGALIEAVPDGSVGFHTNAQRFGDSELQLATAVASDTANGNVVFAGMFCDQMSGKDFSLQSGTRQQSFPSLFAAQLDANGNHLWSKVFVPESEAGPQALSTRGLLSMAPTGEVALAGRTNEAIDFGVGPIAGIAPGDWDPYLVMLAANGDHLLSKRFGDASIQDATQAAFSSEFSTTRLVLAGAFKGEIDFGNGTGSCSSGGLYIVRFDF